MKRLIVSLSVSLVILGTLFFLTEENIISLRNDQIKDIIGKNIESGYIKKVQTIGLRFKRVVNIENKKIDFFLEKIGVIGLPLDSADTGLLDEFLAINTFLEKIRIVNSNLEIVYSTNERDILGSKLESGVYGVLLEKKPLTETPIIVEPLVKNIIFFKYLSKDKLENNRILFYYSKNFLDSIFNKIESLNYQDFLITGNKKILINFPEIDESERKNLEGLEKVISESESGALRVYMKDFDRTIYYQRLSDDLSDWSIGLTLETEKVKISKVGTIILVTQAFVVLSILIFVIMGIKRKEKVLEKAVGREKIPVIEKGVPIKEVPKEGIGELILEVERPDYLPAVEEIEAPVVSLSDVEELTEVQELGEAWVEGELEEVEELEEILEEAGVEEGLKPEEEPETKEKEEEKLKGVEAETMEELEEIEDGEVLEEIGDEVKGIENSRSPELERGGNEESSSNPKKPNTHSGMEETIEDDIRGIESSINPLPRLDKLVNSQQEIGVEVARPYGNKHVQVRESDSGDMEYGLSLSDTERGEIEDIFSKPVAVKEISKALDAEKEETIHDREEIAITIPEGVYREKERINKNDELAHLIDEIEEVGKGGPKSVFSKNLLKIFRQFMGELNLTKGALLIRERNGSYLPLGILGLEKETREKLTFDGNERVITHYLLKGKALHITEDVFFNPEIRRKFGLVDTSKIESLFFVPLLDEIDERDLKGFLIVCLTKEERKNIEFIIKEIKKIRNILIKLI